MTTPMEEIEQFLTCSNSPPSKKTEVALLYAERMVRELRPVLRNWEQVAAELRQTDRDARDRWASAN